jgi:hypothetical protein
LRLKVRDALRLPEIEGWKVTDAEQNCPPLSVAGQLLGGKSTEEEVMLLTVSGALPTLVRTVLSAALAR